MSFRTLSTVRYLPSRTSRHRQLAHTLTRRQMVERTRLRDPNWVSKPCPGGLTRTTRWVDKASHLGGSVIALEVPESRYWVRFRLLPERRGNFGASQWRDVAPVVMPLPTLFSAWFRLRTASGRLSAACHARRIPAASCLAFEKCSFAGMERGDL